MPLTFRGTRTDRPPGDQIRDLLRTDQVEVFGSGWDTHFGQLE